MNNLTSKIVGVLFLSTILVLWWCKETTAGDLVHKFKSPSFSGVGTSSHFLTIENQEFTRKAEIKAKKIAAEEKELSAKRNTNFRKFLDNFESRIYAEFSKQLADAMFGEACGTHYNDAGTAVAPTAEVMEGGASTTNDTQTLHADAGGGTSTTWSTETTVWGKVENVSGGENMFADQVRETANYRFTIRYYSSLTTKYRLYYRSKAFDITNIKILDEGKERYQEILATEGVSFGN